MRDDGGLGDSGTHTDHTLSGGLARDEVFRALADAERRHALAYLRAADRAVPIPELAQYVTRSVADSGAQKRDTADMATSLHHVHLPRLVEADLAEWVRDRQAVTTTPLGQSLPPAVPWRPATLPNSE